MGLVEAEFELRNPRDPSLGPVRVQALVDTGAMHLCIPEHLVVQLKLQELQQREVTLADGRAREVPYVGPVEVRFGNRACYTGALVLGDTVLIGAVPMEDLDLVVHPGGRTVAVNPQSPNLPSSVVKAAGRG